MKGEKGTGLGEDRSEAEGVSLSDLLVTQKRGEKIGADRIGPERRISDGFLCFVYALNTGTYRMVEEDIGRVFMSTEPYPLDTTNLHKGSVITVETLKKITKSDPIFAEYYLKLLDIKSFIEKSLRERGENVTVVSRKGSLVILTDAEAGPYQCRAGKQGARRIRRSFFRHLQIDLSKLTEDQRKEWDRDQIKLSLLFNGVNMKKLPTNKPHKRIE